MVKPQRLELHNSYNQQVIQSGDWSFLGIRLCFCLTSNLLSVQNGLLLFMCENIYKWSM